MWSVQYHPDVEGDLHSLGNAMARRVLKAINEKIIKGEPDKTGKTLSHELAGCKRIRVGDVRIVYKIIKNQIEVLVIAIGPRKDDTIYKTARRRVS